jgi:hypothetical protein
VTSCADENSAKTEGKIIRRVILIVIVKGVGTEYII